MTELDIIKDKITNVESLIEKQSYELEGIRKILLRKECNENLHDDAKDALENIENEIIARACRNGVCED
jgi:hypothetical protein